LAGNNSEFVLAMEVVCYYRL